MYYDCNPQSMEAELLVRLFLSLALCAFARQNHTNVHIKGHAGSGEVRMFRETSKVCAVDKQFGHLSKKMLVHPSGCCCVPANERI